MSWALALLAAVIVAAPYAADTLRPRMNAARRRDAPGQFARLSGGLTHYQWHGPPDGPVAVCVHGLTTPSYVWGPIRDGLVARGFRVLTYDLYGRGYSDRPRGAQDAAHFVSHLQELLQDQEVDADFTLLGYSMGGAIATAYAAQTPAPVRQLVLLATAGLGHDLGPIARLVTNHRWLGSWLMMAWYGRSYRQALLAERDLQSAIPNIVERQMAELDLAGFRGAVLRSMRGILDGGQDDAHAAIHAAGLPVLAIWGREDEVIPIAGRDRLRTCNPDATHAVIENAGHALGYTHCDEIMHILDDLLIVPPHPTRSKDI